MSARRNLLREQPIFAQITAPSTDQDAYLPLHPRAAAVYSSTTQSFMDEYGNWIYLTPMVLVALPPCLRRRGNSWASAAAQPKARSISLYAPGAPDSESRYAGELSDIEDEIDRILKVELAKSAAGARARGG